MGRTVGRKTLLPAPNVYLLVGLSPPRFPPTSGRNGKESCTHKAKCFCIGSCSCFPVAALLSGCRGAYIPAAGESRKTRKSVGNCLWTPSSSRGRETEGVPTPPLQASPHLDCNAYRSQPARLKQVSFARWPSGPGAPPSVPLPA